MYFVFVLYFVSVGSHLCMSCRGTCFAHSFFNFTTFRRMSVTFGLHHMLLSTPNIAYSIVLWVDCRVLILLRVCITVFVELRGMVPHTESERNFSTRSNSLMSRPLTRIGSETTRRLNCLLWKNSDFFHSDHSIPIGFRVPLVLLLVLATMTSELKLYSPQSISNFVNK